MIRVGRTCQRSPRLMPHHHIMRTFPLFIIALLALACALTPSQALAADEKSSIGGTVYFDRNRDGSPASDPGLRGIQVSLVGPKGARGGARR